MTKRVPKSTVVAFKVEQELADFLDQLPNKSDFIRRAIYSQLGVTCPLCHGTGSVSEETHDHLAAFLKDWNVYQCAGCGDEFALPKRESRAAGTTKDLLESVLKGGPEYCYVCYTNPGHRKH